MCQLTLTNINNEEANRLYILLQLQTNTRISHQDGTGFFTVQEKNPTGIPNYIFKFKYPPYLITNWGEVVRRIKGKRPVIAHVRLATSFQGLKIIEDEKAHPFISPRNTFVLAHNGYLELIKNNKEKENKNLIDTEIFVNRLEEIRETLPNYTENSKENIVEALKKTMQEFRGKFAFLIYDFLSDSHFVVCGKTAKLHIAKVTEKEKPDKVLGFVINTDEKALLEGLRLWRNVHNLLYPQSKVGFEEITELTEEKIYLVKETELVEIESIPENTRIVTVDNSYQWNNNVRKYSSSIEGNTLYSLGGKIQECLETLHFPLMTLEVLAVSFFGTSLMNLGEDEFKLIFEYLTELIKEATGKENVRKRTKLQIMEKILKRIPTYTVGEEVYRDFPELSFPWVITDIEKLNDIEFKSRSIPEKNVR